jgi:hypothetical protein
MDTGRAMVESRVGAVTWPCGVLNITCHDMPADSNVQWHSDNCVGQDQRTCPGKTRFFGCGTSAETVAKSYCTQDGVTAPYQIFKYSDRSGNQCGYAAFMVGCHVPAN